MSPPDITSLARLFGVSIEASSSLSLNSIPNAFERQKEVKETKTNPGGSNIEDPLTIDERPLFAADGTHKDRQWTVRNVEAGGITEPRGTFAGTVDLIVRTRDGEVVAADTGDQGGGQN